MKKKKNLNSVIGIDLAWKRRPSEIRGYQKAYYINTEDGDYLRIDYNLRDKRVRLYMEIEEEGGNAYYSIITSGKITAEKSVSSGRSFGFSEKFNERAALFSTVPNRDAFRLINENYGIRRGRSGEDKAKIEKEKLIKDTKRRYFKKEFYPDDSGGKKDAIWFLGGFTLLDLIDIFIGILLSGSAYIIFKYSFPAMGVAAAFFGVIIGFVDMFFRERSPFFFKVILFIISGAALYIYGYFF